MNQNLIIFFPPDQVEADTAIDWLLLQDQRLLGAGSTAVSALAAEVAGISESYSVIALVPAELVLSTSVTVPATQQRQIRQAVPFMVEELIADDVENVHCAIAADFRHSLPQVPTAVVGHVQLIHWLDLLHTHQLSPDAILVDALCLPYEEGGWTALVAGERLLLRTDANQGMAMQSGDAAMLLTSLLQQTQYSLATGALDNLFRPRLRVIASSNSSADCAIAEQLAVALKQAFPDFVIKTEQYAEPLVELISQDWLAQSSNGINLLQGSYAVSRRGAQHAGHWQRVAAVAAVGIAFYLTLTLCGGWYFDYRAQALERQSASVYRQLFPGERRVVNPRRQLQSHLQQQGPNGNSSFLLLLAETARQIQGQQPASAIAVNQLRFNQLQGDLRLEVNSQSLEQLDSFKNQLLAGGLKVDINSASEQNGGVVGRIVVSQL